MNCFDEILKINFYIGHGSSGFKQMRAADARACEIVSDYLSFEPSVLTFPEIVNGVEQFDFVTIDRGDNVRELLGYIDTITYTENGTEITVLPMIKLFDSDVFLTNYLYDATINLEQTLSEQIQGKISNRLFIPFNISTTELISINWATVGVFDFTTNLAELMRSALLRYRVMCEFSISPTGGLSCVISQKSAIAKSLRSDLPCLSEFFVLNKKAEKNLKTRKLTCYWKDHAYIYDDEDRRIDYIRYDFPNVGLVCNDKVVAITADDLLIFQEKAREERDKIHEEAEADAENYIEFSAAESVEIIKSLQIGDTVQLYLVVEADVPAPYKGIVTCIRQGEGLKTITVGGLRASLTDILNLRS